MESKLVRRLEALEAEIAWMRGVLKSQGIEGPWLSPAKAAKVLGVSRDRIMDTIYTAEYRRAIGGGNDLCYGKHYRKISDANAERPSWQVNVTEFAEFLKVLPEKRKIG